MKRRRFDALLIESVTSEIYETVKFP